MNLPIITAHSGCEGTDRDSIESIRLAIVCSADAVEIDVRRDHDHVLRISHDKRNPDEYGQCHTVEEAFAMVSQTGMRINCDMKEAENIDEIFELAKVYGIEKSRLWMTGAISPEQLARQPMLRQYATFFVNIEELFKFVFLRKISQEQLSEFSTLMNTPWDYTREWMENWEPYLDDAIAIFKAVGADGLNVPQWHLNEKFLAHLAQAKIPLSVWTVDDEEMARFLLNCPQSSLVNLTTRQVRMVQRARAEAKESGRENG